MAIEEPVGGWDRYYGPLPGDRDQAEPEQEDRTEAEQQDMDGRKPVSAWDGWRKPWTI